ncbi:MAG TPA: hypothetical protein GXX25_02605 [Desulfotomaculum sp.]|nr:hypothetical protein [Desulfotomaculum sp.]
MEVVVLAVTKMKEGFCVAGMTLQGRWVRLIPRGNYNWPAIKYRHGGHIEVGDVLKVDGTWRYSDPPHSEDYEITAASRRCKLTNQQLLAFCREHREDGAAFLTLMGRQKRSLCLLRVDRILTVYKDENPLKDRLAVLFDNQWQRNYTKAPGFPCTGLQWRAMQSLGLPMPVFREVYVVFGLTRGIKEETKTVPPSPMVISIIGDPPLPGEIDYQNP